MIPMWDGDIGLGSWVCLGPQSLPYTEGPLLVGDVWTHAGLWCYCRGACTAEDGRLSAWALAFAEGRLAGGRRGKKTWPYATPTPESPAHS